MAPRFESQRIRGPAERKAKMLREVAAGYADRFILALRTVLKGKDRELVIEVCRALIRRLSRVVEERGDIGRAHGVLAGAATDLSPAFTPGPRGAADAEALFARKDAA